MNFSQSFDMAIKSISNNKVRSFLTMLGIIIGVCAVIILVTLVSGMQNQWIKEMEKMGTNKINIGYNAWDGTDLTNVIYDYCLENKDKFEGMTPQKQGNAKLKYQTNTSDDTQIYFGNDQFDICNNWEVVRGRAISYNDVKNKSRVIVLGDKAATKLFNLQNPIGKNIKINGNEFTVIGTYKAKADPNQDERWYSPDNMALVPYTTQRLLLKSKTIDQFVVKAKTSKEAIDGVETIRTFLRPHFKNEWDYNVYSEQQWVESNKEQTLIMSLVMGGIAGISLIVGGIGIMNIMLVSVSERTREIGIRKAIGANRRAIVTQFLIEAATVSAVGGIIGIIIGILGSLVLGKLFFKIVLFPTPFIMIFAFLFSISLGIFFGFYPANKASKMNPIDALRTE